MRLGGIEARVQGFFELERKAKIALQKNEHFKEPTKQNNLSLLFKLDSLRVASLLQMSDDSPLGASVEKLPFIASQEKGEGDKSKKDLFSTSSEKISNSSVKGGDKLKDLAKFLKEMLAKLKAKLEKAKTEDEKAAILLQIVKILVQMEKLGIKADD